jgi:osmotically-inducible protein OsmY
VNSDAARIYAAAAAQRVPGVRAVSNTLAVRPGNAEEDRRIALLVQRRIENSVLLKDVAAGLQVSCMDGVIRLQGAVRDALQLAEAEGLAAGTDVVFAVSSELAVDAGLPVVEDPRLREFRTWRPY